MKVSEILKTMEVSDSEILKEGVKEIQKYLGGDILCLDEIREDILYKALPSVKHHYHDEDHVKRVVILGTLLASREDLNKADFKLALEGFKYHDIGRVNDNVDYSHGIRSAELYNKLFRNAMKENEMNIVMKAMALHSISDKYLEVFKNRDDEGSKRIYTVTSFLKDADNLDRVRLGDLDVRYLRNKAAAGLVDFAEGLFLTYNYNKHLLV